MKKELFENINWTAYRKDVERTISNERLWAMGAGDDAELHEQNIEELTEELENIIEGNYQMVIDKYENTMGEDSTVDYFIDYMIEDPEKVLLKAENQKKELFLDALTDIALHTGWEHVEFNDSKKRSLTLRSWAQEFVDKHATTDWEKTDYITAVDNFASEKVKAFQKENSQEQHTGKNLERVSDINIYTGRDSRTYIRCKIDGEWQMSKQLKFADVCRLDDNTDRQELAERYFKSEIEAGQAQEKGLKR